MTDQDPAASTPAFATLQTATRGPVVVNLDDAQLITQALRNFLDTDPSVKTIPMLDPASAARLRAGDTPFIDSHGSVRIGLWLLQARGDSLVLTYRETPPASGKVGYQYVATVGRGAPHQWFVADMSWEKLLAR